MDYFLLGKNYNLLWPTFYAIGQIFIAANGLILTKNVAIWSHWLEDENIERKKDGIERWTERKKLKRHKKKLKRRDELSERLDTRSLSLNSESEFTEFMIP